MSVLNIIGCDTISIYIYDLPYYHFEFYVKLRFYLAPTAARKAILKPLNTPKPSVVLAAHRSESP